MARCRACGRYSDIYEYPEDERDNYNPHLCYSCYQEKLNQPDDDDEESDPNNDYGMGEVKPDPEDDDTPIIEDDEEQSQYQQHGCDGEH